MSTFYKRVTPSAGVVEQGILRVLSLGSFKGPVARLAVLAGAREANTWVALAGLAGRGLVSAQRVGDGLVAVSVTARGRAAVTHRA